MKKFEYKQIGKNFFTESYFNVMGEEGWELVGTFVFNGCTEYFIFKRRKND